MEILGVIINPVLVAGALVLVLIVYLVFSRTIKRSGGRNVLLMGDCEAGKTSIIYTLVYGESARRMTVTSMAENREQVTVKGKSMIVVDIPGHARIRQQLFARHRDAACAVAVVLDSVTVEEKLRDVASLLYQCLADPVVVAGRLPVAVICHKADLEDAMDPQAVEEALVEEIELLRTTSSNRLSSSPSTTSLPLKASTPFSFSALPYPVSFLATSSQQGGGLQALEDWLVSVA